ncbi:G protein alpha subunit [Metarhizium album ARSEF 1941]|uniref:G protein alpha subunit n=1 Tax=Metarhizium album (strain ARSEF 1941) TaxID=1081103 RepID=A0A0B2WUL4_METAS|nr:G protein alpha subunit [Metarhizium album ARSEF 1941]KHN97299.1 G protein alpha subunit [Metarhizium album ARSEF 1941]
MCFGGLRASEEASRSHDIDRTIRKDGIRMAHEVKILLLGAGESGKSTILKQMRIIYSRGFPTQERQWWRRIIFNNIIDTFEMISHAMADFAIRFDSRDNENFMREILTRHEMGRHYLGSIKALWHDSGVKEAVERCNQYAIHDNLAYFIDNMDRLWTDEYVPNDLDILCTRLKTTGIAECQFTIAQRTYRIFDVGGQRSERKKWIHCFEHVDCLLFLVAISGYNQCLVEDRQANQMNEALMLWESLVNSRWFKSSAVILFLNKMDLFIEKLPLNPLSNHGFVDYRGPPADHKLASKYFLDKFQAHSRDPDREIYGHFTTATDTNLVKITMNSVQDMITRRNLKRLIL